MAKKNLDPISQKLLGLQVTSNPSSTSAKEVSVGEQVERLIREARDSKNLGLFMLFWELVGDCADLFFDFFLQLKTTGSMYVGWCAWF